MRLLVTATPVPIPRLDEVALDARVLALRAGCRRGHRDRFGLLPALFASRTNVQQSLSESGRSLAGGRAAGRAHRALVVAEVALAVMLLVGAALLIRSVSRLMSEIPAFGRQAPWRRVCR